MNLEETTSLIPVECAATLLGTCRQSSFLNQLGTKNPQKSPTFWLDRIALMATFHQVSDSY